MIRRESVYIEYFAGCLAGAFLSVLEAIRAMVTKD
jgi:hypothetical protein